MSHRRCEIAGCNRPHVARGWCSTHWSRWKRHGDPLTEPSRIYGDDRARFASKVTIGPIPDYRPDLGPCHLWTGTTQHRIGSLEYGEFGIDGQIRPAHRVAYEWENGPIPAGHVIDHLCRVTLCVRPSHLEAVTHLENVRRGRAGRLREPATHCKRQHEFTPENTRIGRRGERICRECRRLQQRARYVEERARRRAIVA